MGDQFPDSLCEWPFPVLRMPLLTLFLLEDFSSGDLKHTPLQNECKGAETILFCGNSGFSVEKLERGSKPASTRRISQVLGD